MFPLFLFDLFFYKPNPNSPTGLMSTCNKRCTFLLLPLLLLASGLISAGEEQRRGPAHFHFNFCCCCFCHFVFLCFHGRRMNHDFGKIFLFVFFEKKNNNKKHAPLRCERCRHATSPSRQAPDWLVQEQVLAGQRSEGLKSCDVIGPPSSSFCSHMVAPYFVTQAHLLAPNSLHGNTKLSYFWLFVVCFFFLFSSVPLL